MPLNVLVVGASIAGPTAAYWFARAGATVTVIERFPYLRPGGQSIDIRSAGVSVMRKMDGMELAVRAKTTQQDGVRFVRDTGTAYAMMRRTGDPHRQGLSSEYEIFRGDLAQTLYDLTKDDERITYVFGEQVVSMQQTGVGGVAVEFANGLRGAEYDLVVACDGATSRTRAMGLGCGVRDHIRSMNSWAAYFSVKEDYLGGSNMAQLWSTTGGRMIGVGPDPSGGNRVAMLGIHPRDGRDATRPFREAMKQGDQALKDYVAQHFKNAGWKTGEISTAMMKADDFYASEIVQVKVPSLHQGRFALVGDAGYSPCPFTGAGTTLALVGAYTLAGEIGRHKDDLEAGLQAYEERMRPIIDQMQKISFGVPTVFAPQTRWGIWLRNLLVAFVVWSRVLEWAGKFFSASFGADEFGLPDYQWKPPELHDAR